MAIYIYIYLFFICRLPVCLGFLIPRSPKAPPHSPPKNRNMLIKPKNMTFIDLVGGDTMFLHTRTDFLSSGRESLSRGFYMSWFVRMFQRFLQMICMEFPESDV